MFKFFTDRRWYLWSIGGTLLILMATWYQVQLDVRINEWFGEFYDTLQKALTNPNSVSEKEFIAYLFTFAKIAAVYILVVIFSDYFTSHWTFRWRTAMADFYHDKELLRSVMTLIAFTPILWGLSKSITVLPWIGEVEHALVWVAIISALGGTILLASVGIKLPGIEYDIQKEEAAYRKELVLGEDFKESAQPAKITDLYGGVRKIHYKMYFHYLYFNAVKWSYLQGMVIVPYLALAPTIVTGAITLGFVQQIIRAFGRVETSLQYLVRSWPIIVELISVWKRLREFESKLEKNISIETAK